MRAILFISLFFVTWAFGEEEPVPAVEELGKGLYRLGQIEFSEKTRALRIPVHFNLTEGILEFALVHENGKIHEALFWTKASAINLNIALQLLSYQASPELFPLLDEEQRPTTTFPKVSLAKKAQARFRIEVEWEEKGELRKVPLTQLIRHAPSEKSMAATPWIYTGSYFHRERFAAQTTGDYIAIYAARTALFNTSAPDREDDEAWLAQASELPPTGTPATLILKPHSSP